MTQWIGDKWRLKAGPQLGQTNINESTEATTAGNNPELHRCGYKEAFVQEYDGIKVYYHQGSYQHIGPQVYSWAFYEYRMVINSECWNIIIDENLQAVFQALTPLSLRTTSAILILKAAMMYTLASVS